MPAGMTGRWTECIGAFVARTYDNRLGIESVRGRRARRGRVGPRAGRVTTIACYGVRLFTDHWGHEPPGNDFPDLLAAEEEAGHRDPFRSVAALTHTIARVEVTNR